MELQGERLIAAPREKVWAALNDPAILHACIPGCDMLERTAADEMHVSARLTLGGVAGRFVGKLLISGVEPSNGYTISSEGQDEQGSSFSGRTSLRLAEASGGTRLSYSAAATPAGPLAALPPATLEAAARDHIEGFLDQFATTVATGPAAEAERQTQLDAQGKAPSSVLPGLEQVPEVGVPHDPAAPIAHAEPYHPPVHEDHDHDPSNPHYFGLPLGVILAGAVAGISVCITVMKFLG